MNPWPSWLLFLVMPSFISLFNALKCLVKQLFYFFFERKGGERENKRIPTHSFPTQMLTMVGIELGVELAV